MTEEGKSVTLYRAYRITATGLSLLIAGGLTGYMISLSSKEGYLITWHASLMTIGFVSQMAQAIIVLSKDSIYIFLHPCIRDPIQQHWISQGFAAMCIIAGFVIIIVDRNKSDHGHFNSFHAIIGLITVILFFITCSGGIVTVHAAKFKDLTKRERIRLVHVLIGILTFVFSVVSVGTGLYRNEFCSIIDSTARHVFIILLPIASFVVLENPVKTAYSRMKSVFFF